ncbi:MAG: UDP-glucose 4-epimerase, partial [Pseudomonadota bacterium]|nr:UDP-glucose 4-epimerase [Pseudomonadota bacterium]
NLSGGFRNSVLFGEFIEGDIKDEALLNNLFSKTKFDAVIHFASFIQVGESVKLPSKYYKNNFSNTQTLLDTMVSHGIKKFIFSSTAAIFGEPEYVPIDESHPKKPINPYGKSKLMVEQLLEDYDRAYDLKSVCLRYFNAAGADEQGRIGERHEPETHLVPLVLQAASKRRDAITVFGKDYDTPDGTCIRDYIHIDDLCDAHTLALNYLMDGGNSTAFNLGNGEGYSIREVINAAEKVSGKSIKVIDGERREGDPARLIADSKKIMRELGWKPQYAELETIVRHAWQWELKYPWK